MVVEQYVEVVVGYHVMEDTVGQVVVAAIDHLDVQDQGDWDIQQVAVMQTSVGQVVFSVMQAFVGKVAFLQTW